MNIHRDAWKAGIMTIIGAGTGFGFIAYLAGPTFLRPKLLAETYIPGSVNGMAVGSNVTLRGVPIGRVTDLTFPGAQYGGPQDLLDKKYGDYVTVVFEIDAESNKQSLQHLHALFAQAVVNGLRARPVMAGITGGSYLELGVPAGNVPPPFKPSWLPENLYIPAAPGLLDEMLSDIRTVLHNLATFDLQGVSDKLNKLLADADAFIDDDGKKLVADLRKNSEALQVLLTDPKLKEAVANVADAAGDIKHLVKSNTPMVRELLQSLDETMANLEALSTHLRQDPSSIIFTAPPPRLPPSEAAPPKSPTSP